MVLPTPGLGLHSVDSAAPAVTTSSQAEPSSGLEDTILSLLGSWSCPHLSPAHPRASSEYIAATETLGLGFPIHVHESRDLDQLLYKLSQPSCLAYNPCQCRMKWLQVWQCLTTILRQKQRGLCHPCFTFGETGFEKARNVSYVTQLATETGSEAGGPMPLLFFPRVVPGGSWLCIVT